MSRTILIVDDNKLERTALAGFLKKDYNVLAATSGEEALAQLHKNFRVITAIILDVIMPGMTGFEVLAEIRKNLVFGSIPIIIVTSLDDEKSREEAIKLGANGFLNKPYGHAMLLHTVKNAIQLRETSAIANTLRRDKLTGLLNREAFFNEAERMIWNKDPGYYVLSCFDIENFKVINDQYGTEKGDEVLKHIADCITDIISNTDGIACRFSADKFAIMFPVSMMNSDSLRQNHINTTTPRCINRTIRIRIGRYIVDDLSVPISSMYDRATLAEESIKGRYDIYIATYDDSMRDKLLNEQKIVNDMNRALAAGEFEPWLQPQYNHATGALIGAEALVRWRRDGKLVSPAEFIPVFERNGFIYEMDRSIWEQVCRLMRKWLDEGRKPLPVSINISRRDVFHTHFVSVLKGIVDKYKLPYDLIRLEVTESAFAESGEQVIEKVGELIDLGFTVEIDDFGSGYSSLNTLKDVPASILKLDMKFFENTKNKQRSGNIVESVVRMAKWLGMAVIAEGVEEREQADFLKTIGCYYIQGYFYSKPIPVADYEKLLKKSELEPQLNRLETLKTLDNNEFWNPKSMETLIFNSYVGGACIFEYSNGKIELLRANEQYLIALGGLIPEGTELRDCSLVRFLSQTDKERLLAFTQETIELQKENSCEGCLSDGEHQEYVRATIRVIAHAGERYLFYGVVVNISKQRKAEKEALSASERVRAIMDSSHCGITAVALHDDGNVEYLFVNNRFYEILGYTKEQFLAEVTDPFGCIHPDDYSSVVISTLELRNTGENITLQMRAIRRDEKQIWLRADISLVRFADVPYPVQLSSFLDITEQVENEAKQLESARRLEIIMSNVNGGVSALEINDDGTSKFVFNNDKYYSLYGYTNEQAAAEQLDVMSLVVPEDLPVVLEKVRKLKSDGIPTLIDYRIVKPDGTQALLRANSSVMKVDGYGENVITSVVTDITEKKSLEEQLRAIIDNINGGVSATYLHSSGKLRYALVNKQYYNIIGYTCEQFESEVESVFDLVHPDDRQRIKENFLKANTPGQYTMEYRIIRRDGEIRHIMCRTNVMNLFGISELIQLSVSNDITELREAQRREHTLIIQLQTIMDNVNGGITATTYNDDNTVDLVFANDGFFDLYGYTRQQAADEVPDVLSIMLDEERERVLDIVARIVRERGSETYEYRCRKRDGSIVWVRTTNTVISLDGVGDTVLLAVTIDITKEKEAEEQLRFLNDSAHDILAQPDSELAIMGTLERLLKYFGGDRSYVVELDSVRMLSSNTYECCSEGIESQQDKLRELPYGVTDFWYDTLRRNEFVVVTDAEKLDGDKLAVKELLTKQGIRSMILAPLFRDGELVGFSGADNPRCAIEQLDKLKALADYIAILLTRRDLNRKIERDSSEIKTLINDTPGGFVRMEIHLGANPSIVSINEGFCNMLGMTPHEVMSEYGDNAYRCLMPEDSKTLIEDSAEAFTTCGQFTSKCRLNRKNGETPWVMVFGRFIRGENGKLFLSTYFTDINEQKNSEEQQKQLLDNLPCGAALYEYVGGKLNVIHINKRYWELVEREPVTYSNVSGFGMIHHEDKQLVYDEVRAALQQERNFRADFRVRHGDVGYRKFHVVANVVRKDNGTYLFYATYAAV